MPKNDVFTHLLSSDVYSVADAVNTLKSQYVDKEDDQTLAMGIFGYIGSVETAKIQTSITMASELSNEVFPNRAKYDRNIITHAMLYDIADISAIPASIPAVIYIRKADIEQYSVDDKFIIDKNCAIFISDPDDQNSDSYEFHLFYDVILSKVTTNRGEVYTARYDNSVANNLSSITNPYLNAPVSMQLGGETYIGIQVTLSQVALATAYDKLNSSNLIDNKTFIFTHEDQLADFMVYVTEDGITTALTPVYEGGTVPKNVDRFCYYLMLDAEKVRVKFERTSYSPSINAEITVKMQTTKGKSGNFRYTASAIFATLNSENYGYSNIQSMVYIQDDSENGLDAKSADELRSIIPKEALARGAITTTKDVNNYFNQLNTDDNKILMARKVDNQIERTYYAHLLLKDTNGDVIPTNTIKLETRMCDFPVYGNDKYIIPAGAIIELDAKTGIGNLIYKEIDENGIEDYVDISAPEKHIDRDPVILPNGEQLDEELQKINDSAKDSLDALRKAEETVSNAETRLEDGISDYELSTEQVDPDNPPKQNSTGDDYDTIVFTSNESQGGNGSEAEFTADDIKVSDPTYKVVDNLTGVKLIYDDNVNKFMYLVTDDADFEIDNNSFDKFYYTNPYTIIINGGSELYAAYYLCVLDEIKIMNYKYINQKSDVQFICNQIEWYRKFIEDSNTYKLDVSFTQNIQEDLELYQEEIIVDDNGNESVVIIKQAVKAFLILYRNGNPYRYKEGEFKSFDNDTFTFNFQFKLDTKNIILDSENNIRIENLGLCGQEGTDYGYFPGNTEARIYVLVDDNAKAGKNGFNEIVVSGIDKYSVTNMFDINDGVDFFVNYSGIMSSKIDVSEDHSDDEQSYVITSLPVIGYQYAMNENLFDDFVNQLNYKKAYIDNANTKMENSFGTDFKFYNTYGPSELFTLDNDQLKIHRVNIQLNFRLKLSNSYDVYTVDYIKDYVKSAIVENLNDEDSLHIPNLITNVTNKFRESIVFFEFLGIDDYGPGVQHLYHKDVDYVEMVPEFININMLYDKNGNKTPDINIEVV